MLIFKQLHKNDVFALLDDSEESSLYRKCSETAAFCYGRFTGGTPEREDEYELGPLRWSTSHMEPHEIASDALVKKITT